MARFIKRRFDLEPLAQNEKGSNPDIFKYQFCAPDDFGLTALKMTFYEGTEVFAAFKPAGKTLPFHLGFYLKEKGIPTIFTLGEEKFEFNFN